MQEHVERMRSLGCRYEVNERTLLRFDYFPQSRADLNGAPWRTLLDASRAINRQTPHGYMVGMVGRLLPKAMNRVDSNVTIVPYDADASRSAPRALSR